MHFRTAAERVTVGWLKAGVERREFQINAGVESYEQRSAPIREHQKTPPAERLH
jgi:hypothetical protein